MPRAKAWRSVAVPAGQVSSIVFFGVLPVLLLLAVFAATLGSSTFVYDFRGDLYDAGRAIISGRDPYQAAFLDHLAAVQRAGGSPSTTFAVPVYPAPALLGAVPLAFMSPAPAGIVFTFVAIVAFIAGLWLLGVRDWRCYGVAFLSWPLLHSLRLGQVNGLLLLGAAVLWRYRDQVYLAAVALAGVVMLKLLLWPLAAFVLLTKRWRAAALAVVVTVIVTVAAWAAIGFTGMSAYPRMLSDLSAVEGSAGVSFRSVGLALGVSREIADVFSLIIVAGLLGGATWILRRPRGEPRAFGLSVIAAIAASPLVWPHYLTLLFVPIALLSPRISPLWFVPLIAYFAPVELTHSDVWKMVPYLAIELIIVGGLFLTPNRASVFNPTSWGRRVHAKRIAPGPGR